ncbi:class II fructose-bisphosphatase [Paenibacillus alginolyticus]|uniref:Fructose-1,6-bisphosphatase n=1 Tax=Paenibacillus alginolyticus TaxID=59839 RepID=A0ABT4G650_9BACL|nr:class II fructose-bisphosphatase [Paenibacillus alginolyticus]MCY9668615.1 class II fructose-bisphosphatase [Paenibacillus alginolyticus]MCY9691629.1 class II fructose-bisphosphatase [Paenibacillus alginolyticus]MEC0146935.1 class II fructose-bisphosphatase [Paenibacillus alginolyticus]
MERELALEIVRVTELAALASAPWMGRGDKNSADGAATSAMRAMFDSVSIRGTVVIGEGEMDEAPMLYIGEQVGSMNGPEVDIAVDPLEGTDIVAKGLNNALSVIAVAGKGNLLHAPDMYMEKLAVGPALVGILSLNDPMEITLAKAAEVLNKQVSDLTVMILDRVRHESLVKTLRNVGVRIKFLSDGDVAGAMAPAFPEAGIDLYVGSGGAPEGVLAAAALKCLGGELQGRLMPADSSEYDRCIEMGIEDPNKILTMDDMVGTEDVIFAATGVTPGEFLEGVRYLPDQRAETHSIVMRAKTKTIRNIRTLHYLPNKPLLKK